jgi:hypothetical protein
LPKLEIHWVTFDEIIPQKRRWKPDYAGNPGCEPEVTARSAPACKIRPKRHQNTCP